VSAEQPTAPDGDTLFEIGSITKAFTGTLLALEVADGKLALDDPIRKHLPSEVKVPAKEITLLQLATHRSGLPRLPDNLAPKDATNPYADYGVEDLYHGLETCKLRRDPGTGYEYSNLGMGLLGHVLERRSGRSYEQLVVDRICGPLKMTDTRITLSEDQKRRLAPGHLPTRKVVPNWDLPTLAGAGALRSTANDLLRFLEANLRGAYAAAHEPRAPNIGLGWHLLPGAVWHNGGTGGYRSFAAFDPKGNHAVVVLGNATSDTDALGNALLKVLRNVQ
jgi:CubicO group peptidase (beta-lactamase class C family)